MKEIFPDKNLTGQIFVQGSKLSKNVGLLKKFPAFKKMDLAKNQVSYFHACPHF